MPLDHPAVGCPVLVHLAADEALHDVHVGLPGSLHLADLHDPDALELLGRRLVPGVGQAQAVAEPLAAQLPEQGALADARLPVEDQHGVELAAGLQHALDRADQGLPCDGPDVGRVLRAQVVHQQGVHPWHAVPLRQLPQVVPQRIEAALVGDDRQGLGELVLRELDAVLIGHPAVELSVVGVSPVFVRALPRQAALDLDGSGELVEADPLESRMVLEDQDRVGDGGPDGAFFGAAQLCLPVFVVFRKSFRLEVQHGLLLGVLCERQARARVLCCERCHRLVALGVSAALVLAAFIQVAELVDPDQVEGVAELAACRIRRVVRVGEGLAVVDHETGSSGARRVGVAVSLGRLGVDVRQELRDRLRDRVGPAEGADDALLGQRVALLVGLALPDVRHPGGVRPEARVRPVRVLGQDAVGLQEGRVVVLEERLDAGAVARPVHEARRLEGRVVEVVDADLLGDLPGDGLVLVRRDLAVERHDQTVARRGLRVLVRRVDRHGSGDLQVVHEVVPEVSRREVQVQGEDLTGEDVAGLPASFLQVPADEAADVLDPVLLLL